MRTEAERTEVDRLVAATTGIWLGRARVADRPLDDLLVEARRIARKRGRRAGVRVLVARHGHEAAADIVYRHSGRIIRA